MDVLFDDYYGSRGFVQRGRVHTFNDPAPPWVTNDSVQYVFINTIPYFGFGESAGTMHISQAHSFRSGGFYESGPRLSFRNAAPPLLAQHIDQRLKFAMKLTVSPSDEVEHVIGRAIADCDWHTQKILNCDLVGTFDKDGLFLSFSGHLDEKDRTDEGLRASKYLAEILIKWKVLRFIFDPLFVTVMHTKTFAELSSSSQTGDGQP